MQCVDDQPDLEPPSCAETSPRVSSLKGSERSSREDGKEAVSIKEEPQAASNKGVAVEESNKPPTGLKAKKKSGLAGKRSGSQRPSALIISSKGERDAELGGTDTEVISHEVTSGSPTLDLVTSLLSRCWSAQYSHEIDYQSVLQASVGICRFLSFVQSCCRPKKQGRRAAGRPGAAAGMRSLRAPVGAAR